MDNFCDFITSPDWWGVIATIIAAVVAAIITYVLGRRQNRLQEQQLKIQERQNDLQEQQLKLQKIQTELQKHQNSIQAHEMLKTIYEFMHDINFFAVILPSKVCDFLREYRLNQSSKSLDEITNGLGDLMTDFDDMLLDIKIYLSEKEASDCDITTFNIMRVVEELKELIEHNGLKEDYQIGNICSMQEMDYVNAILGCIKEEFVDEYKLIWEKFLESKEVLRGLMNSILTK